MEVFISWHGDASKRVAEALRDWLPCVIQGLKPFLSSEDIHKGDVWFGEVADRLNASPVGILCLTPDALHADWILFEAGALSKRVGQKRLIPLLLGLTPKDVAPPLSNFQSVLPTHDDVLRMIQTINAARAEAKEEPLAGDILAKSFDVWWPKLEAALKDAEKALGAPAKTPAHKRTSCWRFWNSCGGLLNAECKGRRPCCAPKRLNVYRHRSSNRPRKSRRGALRLSA